MLKSNNNQHKKSPIAVERGKRIKLARQLANLTRKDMMTLHNINSNTLHAWEKGVNSVTETSAKQLEEAFSKSGLVLTAEWLLHGIGSGITDNFNTEVTDRNFIDALSIRGDLIIFDEINYFRKKNANAVSVMITDDMLSPIFNRGDYVGGINVFGSDITSLVSEFCIITTNDKQLLHRKILKHFDNNNYLAAGINPFSCSSDISSATYSLYSAAKITRHWRVGLNSIN